MDVKKWQLLATFSRKWQQMATFFAKYLCIMRHGFIPEYAINRLKAKKNGAICTILYILFGAIDGTERVPVYRLSFIFGNFFGNFYRLSTAFFFCSSVDLA